MDGWKSWIASKGVWGGIISVASVLAGLLGYNLADADKEALAVTLAGLGAGLGSVLSIIGRVKAEKKIGK